MFSKENVIEKCLHIDIVFLKENLEITIITKIQDVPIGEQLANIVIKKGASQKELLKVFQSGFIQS